MQKKPLIAILCLVYNQESYLRDCFEGFVMQKTHFPFIVIVHDDASTDKSVAIIRKYQKRYPQIFHPIYQSENQYSKGVSIMRLVNSEIQNTGAKYIAMCEGDDYWTDPLKLQRQVDFLEKNPEYSLSTENAVRLYLDKGKEEPFSLKPTRDIQINELIETRQFATASVVFRTEALYLPPNIKTYDTLIWCILAQHGKVHYNNVISSVYRLGDGVTKKDKIKWAYQIIELNRSLFSVIAVNKNIQIIHDKELLAMILAGVRESLKQKKYDDAWRLWKEGLHINFVSWTLLIKQVVFYKLFH